MNNLSWTRVFGFGLLIWASMFILASVVVAFGATVGVGWSFVMAIVAGLVAYVCSGFIGSVTLGHAFEYGLLWMIIGLVLDFLVSRYFKADIFQMWTYWLGAVLVICAPVVRYELRPKGLLAHLA